MSTAEGLFAKQGKQTKRLNTMTETITAIRLFFIDLNFSKLTLLFLIDTHPPKAVIDWSCVHEFDSYNLSYSK
jgi:hypothetical protein